VVNVVSTIRTEADMKPRDKLGPTLEAKRRTICPICGHYIEAAPAAGHSLQGDRLLESDIGRTVLRRRGEGAGAVFVRGVILAINSQYVHVLIDDHHPFEIARRRDLYWAAK
jgi:hypothetical protein